jgi:hypothetical protein
MKNHQINFHYEDKFQVFCHGHQGIVAKDFVVITSFNTVFVREVVFYGS